MGVHVSKQSFSKLYLTEEKKFSSRNFLRSMSTVSVGGNVILPEDRTFLISRKEKNIVKP